MSNGIIRVKQPDGTYKTIIQTDDNKVQDNEQGKTVTQILAEDVAEKNHTHDYVSDVPTTVDLGGIKKGFTTDGVRVEDMIYNLLHPYISPSITLSCIPNGVVYEIGSNVESVSLVADVIAQSEPIKQIRIYKDGNVVQLVDISNDEDCTATLIEEGLTTNTVYKADVFDGVSTIASLPISFTFVRPALVGNLPADISNGITEDMINDLTKKVMSPASLCNNFTLENSRMCLAVPPGWTITKILDHNGFDITRSFTVKKYDVICIDGQVINYTFYISDITTQTNFNIKFIK